jgi:hypothetical protein
MFGNHLVTVCLLWQFIQRQVPEVKQWVVNKMTVVHIHPEQDWGSIVKKDSRDLYEDLICVPCKSAGPCSGRAV